MTFKRSLNVLLPVGLAAVMFAGVGCSKSDTSVAPPGGDDTPESPVDETEETVFQMPDLDAGAAIVTVDGEELTRGEVTQMAERMLRSQGVPEDRVSTMSRQVMPQLRDRLVDQFVSSTLLKKEAARRNLEATDEEVEAAISKLTERLPPGTDFETALTQMGMSLDDVRREIRENEPIRKLYEEESAKVAAVTDADVEKFYQENNERFVRSEEVEARHILISCDENADAEEHAAAKAKAETLRRQLTEEDADFAALAAAHSDCPSKNDGGSLGSFGRGRMVPAFEEAAFALEPNAISEVIKTPFGYHVIQVTGRSEAGKQSLEEVSEQIRANLENSTRNEVFETLIADLRAKAEIVYAEEPDTEETPRDLAE